MSISYSELFHRKQGDRAATVSQMSKYASLAVVIAPTMPVLDFGCGWGHLLEALARQSIPCEGIDTCEGQVAEAVRHGCKASHVEDSATWLGAAIVVGKRWSTIFLLDVLEHLDAPRQIELLQGLFQALPAGGRLVVKCPNPDSVVGMRMAFIDFTHRFTPTSDALEAALSAIGFSSIQVQDEMSWTEPYKFELMPLVFGNARETRKKRLDLFYFLSQRLFRAIRRRQIASEIGLETASRLPLSPNFLCVAEK